MQATPQFHMDPYGHPDESDPRNVRLACEWLGVRLRRISERALLWLQRGEFRDGDAERIISTDIQKQFGFWPDELAWQRFLRSVG
jgi:hypothetical protein